MRRLTLILMVISLLVFWAMVCHAATVSVSNNHQNFGKGDTIMTTTTVTNSCSPVAVDVYMPGGRTTTSFGRESNKRVAK